MSSPVGEEPRLLLARHAETEWTISHRHTGRSDIPLTDNGRQAARELAGALAGDSFAMVLTSPLRRARETCELAGLNAGAIAEGDLMEWDYGDYEGLTRAEIETRQPDWNLWRDGCPGGEQPAEVAARADRVISIAVAAAGPVAIFSHGHMLRVIGARWAGLGPEQGQRLGLSPGAICMLGHEHGTRIISLWNQLPERPAA